jgi:hypothetical protein
MHLVRLRPQSIFILLFLGACAVVVAADPTTNPAADVIDAQLDAALTAAEAAKEGEAFAGPLQSVAPRFREVVPTTQAGQATWHKVMLNARGKKLDAVRFRVPEGEPRDLVWAFLPPPTLATWYILPTTGAMDGFKQFWRANASTVLGNKAPPGASRVLLQSLPAKNLKPGGEYLLWFRFKDEKPTPLYLAVGLLPASPNVVDQGQAGVIKGLGLTRQGDDLGVVDLDGPTTQPATR